MVENIEIRKFKIPTPYNVSWLCKVHRLVVTEQSVVEFQIGRYQDKVIFDILPMDVLHVLLGKTWQFDRKFVHHRSNSYGV